MRRLIVCPCEDVTVSDVKAAVATGHADMESVKRFTGVATGPCQGKQCLVACTVLLGDLTGLAPEDVGTIVHRPPTTPMPLGLLAGEREEGRDGRSEGAVGGAGARDRRRTEGPR